MTLKTYSQKSPSDESSDERGTVKSILRDVKKAGTAKKLVSEVASGRATPELIAIKTLQLLKHGSVITKDSTPKQILEILKLKFDLSSKPSIEYIDHVMSLDDVTRNKIQAVLCVYETDLASQDLHVFEKVGMAFNNRIPVFDHIVPLTIGECAWTVKCISEIRSQDFTDEVCFYIAATAVEYGLLIVPESLKFTQSYLDKLTGVTETADLYKAYRSGKSEIDLYTRQIEKLSAVDAYVSVEAKV